MTFVMCEKTDNILTSYAEGSFTHDQVRMLIEVINSLDFCYISSSFLLLESTAPAGFENGEECQ